MPQAVTAPVFRRTADTFATDARTLPQRYFVSPEVLAEEQERIFSRHWMLVGHQSQIAKSGDYFVQEVAGPPSQGFGAAGESLIIARDQTSKVRAFYNVCRHRGTRLCEDPAGHSSTIQCPYHAWTYALDGRLVGAPHMTGETIPGSIRLITRYTRCGWACGKDSFS
jgi:Rieske 2Fe-2S family protein